MNFKYRLNIILLLSTLLWSFLVGNNLAQLISLDSVYVTSKKFDQSDYWNSKPLINLPKHIPIYDDQIYLYADFDDIIDHTISVYIINNSQEKFSFDGYLLMLLQQEFKDTNNIWTRSQPYSYGWCGTGYMFEDGVRPGEFTKVRKVFTNVGEKREIRFKFFKTSMTVSNSGIGYIVPENVEEAKYDDIALRICNSDFLTRIIKGEIKPFEAETENETVIRKAICNLALYFPEEAIPILESFEKDSSSKYQKQAISNLESIERRKQKK